MASHSSPAIGLEYLLGLDGHIEVQNNAGYWVKMEVASVPVTADRPHGIRYSLTLHAPDNTRLIGFDNAHSVKPVGSRFEGDQSMNKVLKFGIAPVPVQRARSLAIAAGTRQRAKDEPHGSPL